MHAAEVSSRHAYTWLKHARALALVQVMARPAGTEFFQWPFPGALSPEGRKVYSGLLMAYSRVSLSAVSAPLALICPYLPSSETTAKGTGLEKLAGKEDPVELDSSLAL